MKRLLWISLGAAGAAVALHQLRKAAEHSPTARLVQRAVDAGVAKTSDALDDVVSRSSSSLAHMVEEYRTASAERATQLRDSLLADTQGSEDELRARRAAE